MEFQKYPAKRYAANGDTKYVHSAEEEAALGKGWFDSPKKAAKPAKADKE